MLAYAGSTPGSLTVNLSTTRKACPANTIVHPGNSIVNYIQRSPAEDETRTIPAICTFCAIESIPPRQSPTREPKQPIRPALTKQLSLGALITIHSV